MSLGKEVLQTVLDENEDEYSTLFLHTVEKVCEYALQRNPANGNDERNFVWRSLNISFIN